MARKKGAKRTDELLVTEEEKAEPNSWENEDTEETERQQPAEVVEEVTEVTTPSVTEGPLLTSVVIKTYNGKFVNDLFEGEGYMEFTDGHIYKGSFHQGLMHGQGFYKWNDGVTYEGDFMFNYITGKGTYTYLDGSTYEGDVMEGKRHGYGIYNWKAEGKCYTGCWHKGMKHGKGYMQFDEDNQSFYYGDWQSDLPHGWGIQKYSSNNMYEGFWFKNKPNVEGVMKWFVEGRPKDIEIYKGHWANGIQQGYGEQVWVTYRAPNTQFNGQNLYKGNFVNGKRHGHGTFYYADGSKYKGEWFEDMKHGYAKFTQRTGEVYEGVFENNGLPNNVLVKGLPALVSEQDTKSPFKNFKMKSIDSNFMLDVDALLEGYKGDVDPERELTQVSKNVWRHIGYLKKIYLFYASLGQEPAIDNIYLMENLQFWRFLKDCCLHHHRFTLMQMDRILGKDKKLSALHDPFRKLLLREFIANLVILAFKIYVARYNEMKGNLKSHYHVLDWCLSQLLRNNIRPNVYNVKGHIYTEVRKAINIMEHVQEVYKIYIAICKPRKLPPHDFSMKMRDCLVLLKDLNLINENLTSKAAIGVLAEDDPNVIVDGNYNMELEMTYLEFLEALVGFAEIYITESVVESLTISVDAITLSRSPKTSSQHLMSPVASNNISITSFQQHLKREAAMEEKIMEEMIPEEKLPEEKLPEEKVLEEKIAEEKIAEEHIPETEQEEQLKTMSLLSPLESVAELSESRRTSNGETEGEVEAEELDQATKKYNFWTHQIHIFFIEKFIRPVKSLLDMRQIVRKLVRKELKRKKKIEQQKAATERWYQLRNEAAALEPSPSQDQEQEQEQNPAEDYQNVHFNNEPGVDQKPNSPNGQTT